jgi:type I restriction-modification system DNA methylase subunit
VGAGCSVESWRLVAERGVSPVYCMSAKCTLLRLPTGLFYAQGVKAKVGLLSSARPSATTDKSATSELWVNDFRTDQHFTLKTKQLTRADLDDFVEKYRPGRRHTILCHAREARAWRGLRDHESAANRKDLTRRRDPR